MARNWGIPSKTGAFAHARDAKPLMTLAVTAIYGVIGASFALLSFSAARAILANLFEGASLIGAVVAAGFGCWLYVFLALPRFAAMFSGGDGFSELLRFYGRGGVGLVLTFGAAWMVHRYVGATGGAFLYCFAGGVAAAAAFQTVLTFVPMQNES